MGEKSFDIRTQDAHKIYDIYYAECFIINNINIGLWHVEIIV